MPKWIHDRAEHILRKNPNMKKSMAFAIATQQAYAAGKAPKRWGTREGRAEAKQKYDEPRSHYKQTANPKLASLVAEPASKATVGQITQKIKNVKPKSLNAHPKYTTVNTSSGLVADPGSQIKSST